MSADELSEADLEAMVREIDPEWSLQSADRAPQGTDLVYFVTVDTPAGERECVLKACSFVSPEAFRPEPIVLEMLDRETSIPVPAVYGRVNCHDTLPAPFFCMERRPGEVREGDSRTLPPAVVERIARTGGRYLGELHAYDDFERFGWIELRDCPSVDDPPTADALVVAEAGHETWRGALEAQIESELSGLHERFADLEEPLRKFLHSRLDAVEEPSSPVFGNTDYRLGNLLIDVDTGETHAVIDWGNCHTTEPVYNLVALEENLCGRGPLEDPLRRRVRRAIDQGYAETGSTPGIRQTLFDGGELTRRGELYYGITRLAPLVWFSLWYADATTDERAGTADRHRRVLEGLLERAA